MTESPDFLKTLDDDSLIGDNIRINIKVTQIFDNWLKNLKDKQGRGIIMKHIDRMNLGNPGKIKNICGNIFEKKIYFGPGYRLYFIKKNDQLIIILCSGDKSTQKQDIEKAKILAMEL